MNPVSEKRYLPEIQGLRTLAALLVAVYHIWFQRVSGGVDVFFVVAAFFMVLSLARHQSLQFSHIAHYFLNTLRRMLPVLAVVLVVTSLGIMFFSPEVVWRGEIRSALASLFFYQNAYLARQGSDYLNQGLEASAFQQMWALSLQMQMAIFLPLLVYGVARCTRHAPAFYRRALVLVLLGVGLVSLGYSVVFTQLNQPAAYFSTGTRLWEFVLGGLLALLITQAVIAKPVSHFLGISGVLVLVLFGWLCDVSAQFPGYMALVPCLAACAIIAAAYNGGYVPLAGSRFMVRLASYSFAFYLWHWPLLCFYRSWAGTAEVGVLPGLGIIGVSFVLAYISTRLFELPVRHSAFLKVGYKRTLGFAGAAIVLVLVPVALVKQTYETRKEHAEQVLVEYKATMLGASASAPNPQESLIPYPVIARKDRPKPYDDGCNQETPVPEMIVCFYGPENAVKVVALVGGSHSAQWFSALEMVANQFNFRLVNITKSGCALTLSDPGLEFGEAAWESCLEWNLAVLAKLSELKPDLVVTIGTRVADGVEFVPDGYRMAWKWLEEAGVDVLALRDNPRFKFDVPYCLETHRDRSACGIPEADYYGPENPLLSDTPPNVFPADFSDLYCQDGFCPPVIDNILIYRDKNHLTDTFVMKYHDVLGQAVVATGKVF